MPIVGMSIDSIEAKKNSNVFGGVKVKSNTDITNVISQTLHGTSTKALSVGYDFNVEYISEKGERKLAEIKISGKVLVVDAKHEEIFKSWKEKKVLPENVSVDIINTLLDKCTKKALILSDDLQLPPPIALPFAQKRVEEEK